MAAADPSPELLAAVSAIARRELGVDAELTAGLKLVEDLGLDSLQRLTLAVAVEDRFEVELDEEEGEIVTVGDLVAVVAAKLARRDEPAAPAAGGGG